MWTSTALASEHRSYEGRAWRVVEAQHRISTSRLATDLEAQAQLEDLAEEVKPRMPASTAGLDYLLASPFRYGHRQESRFRRADERPGIFYASEAENTAIAETAYWRLKFFTRSPGFVPPSTTSEHSSFSVRLSSKSAIDLTLPPFDADQARWIDPVDYSACQQLAAAAREAQTALIRTTPRVIRIADATWSRSTRTPLPNASPGRDGPGTCVSKAAGSSLWPPFHRASGSPSRRRTLVCDLTRERVLDVLLHIAPAPNPMRPAREALGRSALAATPCGRPVLAGFKRHFPVQVKSFHKQSILT
jgi:hypothetical protein